MTSESATGMPSQAVTALMDRLRALNEEELRRQREETRAAQASAAYEARSVGVPIRRIGALLGVSHATVMRMVHEHAASIGEDLETYAHTRTPKTLSGVTDLGTHIDTRDGTPFVVTTYQMDGGTSSPATATEGDKE